MYSLFVFFTRFDGQNFLEKLRGKTIMFVGDSLSRNQWLSMLCIIHSSMPKANYAVNISLVKDMTTYTFTVCLSTTYSISFFHLT